MSKSSKSKPVTYTHNGIDEAIAALRSQYGRKALFVPPTRRYIPMRHQALGTLLSGPKSPGLPTGTYIETVGEAHSGKTSFTFAAIEAMLSQPGGIHVLYTDKGRFEIPVPRKVYFADYEQVLDTNYLQEACPSAVIAQVGEDGEILNAEEANVYIHQPDLMEEGLEIALHLFGSGEFGMGIFDSVAAMLPREEAEKRTEDSTVGVVARAMGKFFRKSVPIVRRYGIVAIVVNQWRQKIGTFFGDPRITPGGKASNFFDSMKLDIMGPQHTPWFDRGKTVRIKCIKNKVWGTKGEVTYHLRDGWGLSAEVEWFEIAQATGVIHSTKKDRPVFLSPVIRGKKIVECRKKFANVQECLVAMRSNGSLFEYIRGKCERHGYASGLTVATKGSGGLKFDD